MAKRFTDTEKWKDPWFSELSGKEQLFWLFLLDTCDHAGVWKKNFKFFTFYTGFEFSEKDLSPNFLTRVILINSETYFIPKFIEFQYPKFNPESNNAHKGVLNSLNYNKIQTSPYLAPAVTLPRGTGIGKGTGIGYGIGLGKVLKEGAAKTITPDDVIQAWNESMGPSYGYCPGLGCGEHLGNFFDAIQFLPTVKHWTDLFEKCLESEFLKGNNKSSWTVNLLWLVDYDNALKVLSDNFDDNKLNKKMFADAEAIIRASEASA